MKNLTEEEILALPMEFNLADGHAYRRWSPAESALIDQVPRLFHALDRRDRQCIERRYLETFFAAAGQSFRPERFAHHLCFTASMALEAVANLIRLEGWSVALIEPCFDNLYDILMRHGIQPSPLPEDLMHMDSNELAERLKEVDSHVLMLVSPNNPTGAWLSSTALREIVDFCLMERRILVLDATFRFYLPSAEVFDQYALLADSGVDCIVIEDTGKTWPTLELKAPFFSVSASLAPRLANIYSDFLLHVSPVSVALLTQFIELGLSQVHEIVDTNRCALHDAVQGLELQPVAQPFMSVEWLKVTGDKPSQRWRADLAGAGVHVLAGHQFFWSNQSQGDWYLRFALVRDPEMFRRAMERIKDACRHWSPEIGANHG